MKLEIIAGHFYEGEYVTVSMGGNEVRRKVYYSRDAGDLYINYKGSRYFCYEFLKGYTGDFEPEK